MVKSVIHPVILGLDTSGHHCAVALRWGDDQVAHITQDMAKGQAERLLPMVQNLMDQEGYDWSDLDAVAVGIGPGNFTGIRIGVSAARGLALALDIPAIGGLKLRAVARRASDRPRASTDQPAGASRHRLCANL